MKVLLAVDDSKYSQAAIQSVLQKVHPTDAEVCVLHVLEPILEAQWSSHHVYAEMIAQRRQEATEMVKRAAESTQGGRLQNMFL
ncbi:MAG: universal stress protein [Candidatus Acidiferrales bacterium]